MSGMTQRPSRPTTRVVIVHGNEPCGLLLASRLAALGPDLEATSRSELGATERAALPEVADLVLLPPTTDLEALRLSPEDALTLLWTGEADPALERRALRAGLAGTLPVEAPAALEAAIERTLAWHRRLRHAHHRSEALEPAVARWVWDASLRRLLVDAGSSLPVPRDEVRAALQATVVQHVAPGAEAFHHETVLQSETGPVRLFVHGAVVQGPAGPSLRGQVTARPLRPPSQPAPRDALTGLPGRESFLDHLVAAHARLAGAGRSYAVVCVDLDGVHAVNDGLGHAVGDLLLRWAAERIRETVPDRVVARVGSDEFAILLLDDPESPEAIGRRVVTALTAPVSLGGNLVYASARAGTARAADAQQPADAVFRDAQTALVTSRRERGARLVSFTGEARDREVRALHLDRDLRSALQERRLEVHFQPIVRLADGSPLGFEALLRWKHPEHGWIPPSQFVPQAERSGLIVPIGRWVLEEACQRLRELHAARPDLVNAYVAVNLSPAQLLQTDLVRQARAALDSTGLASAQLRFEITEASTMTDSDATLDRLADLRALGVRILIDDFGTGWSALQYLAHLPADVLKVDRAFIDGLGQDERKTRVVGTIADLAESLGLGVVAEGVETTEQLAWLRRLGVADGQGYLFSRPIPVSEVARTWGRSPRP
jgi:diguanylate cyclase (GGDEF)-like protein